MGRVHLEQGITLIAANDNIVSHNVVKGSFDGGDGSFQSAGNGILVFSISAGARRNIIEWNILDGPRGTLVSVGNTYGVQLVDVNGAFGFPAAVTDNIVRDNTIRNFNTAGIYNGPLEIPSLFFLEFSSNNTYERNKLCNNGVGVLIADTSSPKEGNVYNNNSFYMNDEDIINNYPPGNVFSGNMFPGDDPCDDSDSD